MRALSRRRPGSPSRCRRDRAARRSCGSVGRREQREVQRRARQQSRAAVARAARCRRVRPAGCGTRVDRPNSRPRSPLFTAWRSSPTCALSCWASRWRLPGQRRDDARPRDRPHLVELAQFLDRGRRHERAAVGHGLEPALVDQAMQRLAHALAADLQQTRQAPAPAAWCRAAGGPSASPGGSRHRRRRRWRRRPSRGRGFALSCAASAIARSPIVAE